MSSFPRREHVLHIHFIVSRRVLPGGYYTKYNIGLKHSISFHLWWSHRHGNAGTCFQIWIAVEKLFLQWTPGKCSKFVIVLTLAKSQFSGLYYNATPLYSISLSPMHSSAHKLENICGNFTHFIGGTRFGNPGLDLFYFNKYKYIFDIDQYISVFLYIT